MKQEESPAVAPDPPHPRNEAEVVAMGKQFIIVVFGALGAITVGGRVIYEFWPHADVIASGCGALALLALAGLVWGYQGPLDQAWELELEQRGREPGRAEDAR